MQNTKSKKGFHDHIHLGNFSLDENRNYFDDHSSRRFFVHPGFKPKFNLLDGLADFVDRDRSHGHGTDDVEIKSLDGLLRWMRDHATELERKGIINLEPDGAKSLSVKFVTRRGALHDLFKAAHLNDRCECYVTLYGGTYYLEQLDIRDQRVNPRDPDGIQMYSGKKFAQYCTSADGERPNTTAPIDDNRSYEAVMATRCGDVPVLFSVEVHAEVRYKPQPMKRNGPMVIRRHSTHHNYVNIRTTREFNGVTDIQQSKAFFRKKLFQFWSQNHIAGIPRVILGWRDDQSHVITRVETYVTEDIPSIPLCTWDPVRYYTMMQNLFADIAQHVTDDDACVVYHLVLGQTEHAPYRDMMLKLSERRFKVEAKKTDNRLRIVKDWFIRDVLKATAASLP